MSEADSQPQMEQTRDSSPPPEEQMQLKRLEFVRVAVLQALVLLSSTYEFAKDKSGPLKPVVQGAESTARVTLCPVYEKLRDVPLRLLHFADSKVDQCLAELRRHVPPSVREAYEEVGLTGAAASLARAAVSRYEPAVKEVYARYEPEAERYAVAAWKGIHQLPMFPQLAQIAVPTAAYWADKYNASIVCGREKGYALAIYLPPVPVKRIAKVFGSPEDGKPEPITTSEPVAQ